jgi:NADPH:quinone reductase-like Zn-dependent oxidoreductase
MKAMVLDRYGSPDLHHLADVAKPVPNDNDLLVKVHASSVNASDWHFQRGKPILVRLQFGLFRPKIHVLGYDMAGTVEQVGGNVSRFKVGDEVFGGLGFVNGGFAEYARISADGFVAHKPSNVTFEQAGCVPGAGVAALIALRERGNIKPGRHVLINGSSGGVGTFSVQIAKALGAEVTAVCSTGKVDMVKKLGADHVIDYTRRDFCGSGQSCDLLLDNVGNRTVSDMLRVVRPGGTVVIVGFTTMRLMLQQSILGPGAAKRRGVHWDKPSSREPGREHAETLGELMAAGKVVAEIEKTYSLEELPEAMRRIESGHAMSKIGIRVG